MTYRDLIFMTCGLAIGAAASYYVTKRKVEESVWKEYQAKKKAEKEEKESSEDEVQLRAKNNPPDFEAKNPENGPKVQLRAKKNPNLSDEDLSKYTPDVSSKDLLASRNESADISVKNGYIPLVPGPEAKNVVDEILSVPYFISDSEYAADQEHASAMITWYSSYALGCDESDTVIPDVGALVGMNNIETMMFNGVNQAFIRNPEKNIDYVVNICAGEPPFMEGPLPGGE